MKLFSFYKMKSAVIIGGGGALGKGMVQRLKKSEWNIINIDFVYVY